MTPKAASRLEWILGAYKVIFIVGLSCAGIVAIVGICVFLLVGGCTVAAMKEFDKAKAASSP